MAIREYTFIVGPETSTIPTVGTPVDDEDIISLGYLQSYGFTIKALHDGVQTIQNCKDIPAAERDDMQLLYIDALGKYFYFDSGSAAAGNDLDVIVPTSGTGRWVMVNKSFLHLADTPTSYGTAHKLYKVNSGQTAIVEAPITCDDAGLVKAELIQSEGAILRTGDGATDETSYWYAYNGDANKPFVRYDHTANVWQVSDNGVATTTISSAGPNVLIADKAGNYTILDGDGYRTIVVTATGTIDLPTLADNQNRIITIKKGYSGNSTVTVDGEGAETIDGTTTKVLDINTESITVQAGSSEWKVIDWTIPENEYTLSVSGSAYSWSTQDAIGIVRKTISGAWWIKYFISGSVTGTGHINEVITITGVVHYNGTYPQTGVTHGNAGIIDGRTQIASNTNTIDVYHTSKDNTYYSFFADVKLKQKPTFVV